MSDGTGAEATFAGDRAARALGIKALELSPGAAERHRYGRSGIYDVTVSCGDRVVAEFRGLSRQLR